MFKVFFSWQSDLPEISARIKDAINGAINAFPDCSLEESASNSTGSPNIVSKLFENIEEADLFIADLSLAYRCTKKAENGEQEKYSPNPNVLIELGYAAKVLGWERIICIVPKDNIINLPFDINQHRVVPLDERLEEVIGNTICAISSAPPHPKPNSTIEEKFTAYLFDAGNWVSIDEEQSFYYKRDPDFRIETDRDDRDGYEYYFFSQIDSRPSWWKIKLIFRNNVVQDTLGVGLDGCRFFTCVPYSFQLRNDFIYCYTKGTLQFALYHFFRYWPTDRWPVQAFEKIILFFESKEEEKRFQEYAEGQATPVVEGSHVVRPLPNGENASYYYRLYGLALGYQQMLEDFRQAKE